MHNIGITGATGRMGQLLMELLENHSRYKVVAAATSAQNPLVGTQFHGCVLTKDSRDVFSVSDVVIDFSSPEASAENLKLARHYQRAMVLCTTGLNEAHEKLITQAATVAPIVCAANASLGVTLMQVLVMQAAKVLDDSYDVEIFEAHHRHKKDSPSGTAFALGRAVAAGRNVVFEDKARFDRASKNIRREYGEIGFSSHRGGHIIGDHSVIFYGDEEVLEITHRGLSRKLYVRGAIKAAEWVYGQAPGVYGMQDVLSNLI